MISMKSSFFLSFFLFLVVGVSAQIDREPPTDAEGPSSLRIHSNAIYGKLVDKSTGKAIEAASVQLYPAENKKDSLLTGMLSKSNGEFRLQNLPALDSFRLVISAMGYKTWEQVVIIGNKKDFQKDLGNILLQTDFKQLPGITITASRPALEMGIDRKIFNVDKSLSATGGTAIDIMKNIPSVSVDIDGNVELRNRTPQIFVDGRPTTLTLDQIPADHIDKIELITNPSAKFDASSSGGIINIILKKNKRVGLNGIATVSGGTPELFSSNLNVNLRQGKFNFFVSGGYNQSGGKAKGKTMRQNKDNGTITDYFNQYSLNERSRRFSSLRFGTDFFIDNRNTITVSQDLFRGKSGNEEAQDQEYLNSGGTLEYYGKRITVATSRSGKRSTRVNYKHSFAEEGKELTADINYNQGNRTDNSTIQNSYFFPDGSPYQPQALVWNNGKSNERQITFQSDFANPVSDKIKIETGIRSNHNKFRSFYNAFTDNNGQPEKLPLSNNYAYTEMVNAAYFTFSYKQKTFSFQSGLRAEHSKFSGELIDSAYKFAYENPNKIGKIWDALFPSFFITKKIGESDELQLNYTRRIRRPRFFQLNPLIDINDPINLQQGNPGLRPEYINSFELNYSRNYTNGNFLVMLYFSSNPNDITEYSDTITAAQYRQLNNAAVDPNAILHTFINAGTTKRYGAEFTLQHSIGKNFDITPNVDLEYRTVNAKVNKLDLSNEGFNWEAGLIINYKIETVKKSLFNNLGFQLNGNYESPQVIPQGRQIAEFDVDLAIRKDFLKDKKAAVTFALNDVFNSRRSGTIYDTEQFYQDSYRRGNVRNFRISITYKFGDANFSFSKKGNGDGDDE